MQKCVAECRKCVAECCRMCCIMLQSVKSVAECRKCVAKCVAECRKCCGMCLQNVENAINAKNECKKLQKIFNQYALYVNGLGQG